MRRGIWWRPLAALLLVAGTVGVGWVEPEPASAAPVAPGFVCPPGVKPDVCVAVEVVEQTLRLAGLEKTVAGSTALGVLDFVEDVLSDDPSGAYPAGSLGYFCNRHPAIQSLPECGGSGPTPPGFLARAFSGIREAAIAKAWDTIDPGINGVLCGIWPGAAGCPGPGGTFVTSGGPPIYEGPLQAMYDITHSNIPGKTLVVAWPIVDTAGEYIPLQTWGGGNYGRLEVRTLDGGVQFRMCGKMATQSACSSASEPTPDDQGVAVVGIRANFTGCSYLQQIQLVSNGGVVTSGSNNLARYGFCYVGDGFTAQEGGYDTWVQLFQEMELGALVEKIGIFDPDNPPSLTGIPESPYPGTDTPPGTVAPPGTVPEPAPAPTTTVVPPATPSTTVTEAADEEGWFDRLGNRIGGFFDNLGSMIGGAFGWLGDLMSNLFGWLVQQLWAMFGWLVDQLTALFGWLGGLLYWIGSILQLIHGLLLAILQAITNGFLSLFEMLQGLLSSVVSLLRSIAGTLGGIFEAILSLPGLIVDALLAGLQTLFVPSAAPALPACSDTFPCNWVAEVGSTVGELQAGITGVAGCEAPSIGWEDGFSASFPPPPGCSGGNAGAAGANDSVAGDLFGWRSTIRTVLALGLWLGFIAKVLAMAPWSKRGEMPLSEGVTVG